MGYVILFFVFNEWVNILLWILVNVVELILGVDSYFLFYILNKRDNFLIFCVINKVIMIVFILEFVFY